MRPLRNIAIASGLLTAAIALPPMLAPEGTPLVPPFVFLTTAGILVLLVDAPAFDVQRGVAILKPLVPAALLPATWMLLQMMPLPFSSLGHPIWRSAAAALAEKLFGHISIDLGFTLHAFFEYLCLSALVFTTCILGRNRDRAENILFALSTVTTIVVVALMLLPAQFVVDPRVLDYLVAVASLGAILNTASTVQRIERSETRAHRSGESRFVLLAMMLLWNATSALVCLFALLRFASRGALIAAALGWTIFMLVLLIRRLDLGRWIALIVSTVFVVAFVAVVTIQLTGSAVSHPVLAFAPTELANESVVTCMMLSDTGWAGSGVGSYHALAAIYRDAGGALSDIPVNTMAAAILEWGYLGVLLVAVPLLQQLIVLCRGALSRGQDWFYAAAAAGCLATMVCEMICDASLTKFAVRTLAAVIVGLGLAQTVGIRSRSKPALTRP